MPFHVMILRQRGEGAPRSFAFDREREWVDSRVVERWARGEEIVIAGSHWSPRDVQISIYETTGPLGVQGGSLKTWRTVEANGVSRTDELLARPAGGAAPGGEELEYAEDRRVVMVVNGRDGANAEALFTFLRAIDLRPQEWSELVGAANSGAPYIGQVLDEAFARAQAVVVLQTPDDVAYLRTELVPGGDPEGELVPRGQARPNVFFEAGMAIGRFPGRTVFVEVGSMRPASDLAGRHAVRVDGGPEWRSDLAKRLERAGCAVNLDGTAWLSAGDFVLPGEVAAGAPAAPVGPQTALIRRIDAFLGDLHGNGQASMTLATTYNQLVEASGVEGIQPARPISRAMSELSNVKVGDMRVLLGQVKASLAEAEADELDA